MKDSHHNGFINVNQAIYKYFYENHSEAEAEAVTGYSTWKGDRRDRSDKKIYPITEYVNETGRAVEMYRG